MNDRVIYEELINSVLPEDWEVSASVCSDESILYHDIIAPQVGGVAYVDVDLDQHQVCIIPLYHDDLITHLQIADPEFHTKLKKIFNKIEKDI